MEFVAFSKIPKLTNVQMIITQKIHGTNAQIYVDDRGKVTAGSRTRWIFPGDDNFGFAAWVAANEEVIAQTLGPGRHYGEWAGPGVNSSEGLKEKTLVLFDVCRYKPDETGEVKLPPNTVLAPLLYEGPFDLAQIDAVMEDLKTNGSRLVPGFMRPEGIVVSFAGQRFKKVFTPEDTQWTKSCGAKPVFQKINTDYNYLCQPVRLEKLLCRDEAYMRDFPKSLSCIVKDYVADLIAENEITGTPDEIKAITKGASSQIFSFIRISIENADHAYEGIK